MKCSLTFLILMFAISCSNRRQVVVPIEIGAQKKAFSVPESLYGVQTQDAHGKQVKRFEYWTLYANGQNKVEGNLQQRIAVTALGDKTFECNKGNSYEITMSCPMLGEVRGSDIIFEESQCSVPKSRCNDMAVHILQRSMSFSDGKITVSAEGKEYPLSSNKKRYNKNNPRARIANKWSWAQTTKRLNTTTTEKEIWDIKQKNKKSMIFVGTIERNVSVKHDKKKKFKCADAHKYGYKDVYDIEGTLNAGSFFLSEVAHRGTPHPCVGHTRILDQAYGELHGTTLELMWKGRHLQTLTRID